MPAIEVRRYVNASGRIPFDEWLTGLRDLRGRARILVRLDKAAAGNLGDHKSLGDGLIELREHHGPGYRLYAGRDGATLVILVTGGDKSSQAKDIAAARLHWQDYRSQQHEKARKP